MNNIPNKARLRQQIRDCRDLPILRRVWTQLTSKYALELALLDGGPGVYPVQVFWHPDEPSDSEMLELRDAVSAEFEQFSSFVLKHNGKIGGAK